MLEIWGCGLSTSVAYTRIFMVYPFLKNVIKSSESFGQKTKIKNNNFTGSYIFDEECK